MKKSSKDKSPQSSISVDQDVVGLITTLVQKLVSLEAKIDTVLTRLSDRPVDAPRQQFTPNAPAERKDARQMFKVICADCGKNCEVPFKPSLGRAVYCKECFTRRKAGGNFKPQIVVKPDALTPARQVSLEKPPAAKPEKPAAAKKKAPAKKTKKK